MAKRALFLWLLLSAADLSYAAGSTKVSSQYCVPPDSCCKVCTKGQACGNTCISTDANCHQDAGCACDSEQICR